METIVGGQVTMVHTYASGMDRDYPSKLQKSQRNIKLKKKDNDHVLGTMHVHNTNESMS